MATESTAATLSEVFTPALVLDYDRMKANIQTMVERTDPLPLRPHLKTCKSLDVAREIMGNRREGITVSTLKEAEYFFEGGYNDILYGVGMSPGKVARAAALVREGAVMRFLVDDVSNAVALGQAAQSEGITLDLLIELDTDGHRSGLVPGDPQVLTLGTQIDREPALRLMGVLTHAGESYTLNDPASLEAMAEQERAGAVLAADRLRSADLPCEIVSVGSTPTALSGTTREGLTEIRAGVYVFQDLVQANIGVCRPEDIVLSVVTTVIGHKKDRGWLLVDAGGLALSKDRGTANQPVDYGYGLATQLDQREIRPRLQVRDVNQEHGILASIEGPIDWEAYPIGSRLRILPNHACMTAAAYEAYHVVRTGNTRIEAVWPRINGW